MLRTKPKQTCAARNAGILFGVERGSLALYGALAARKQTRRRDESPVSASAAQKKRERIRRRRGSRAPARGVREKIQRISENGALSRFDSVRPHPAATVKTPPAHTGGSVMVRAVPPHDPQNVHTSTHKTFTSELSPIRAPPCRRNPRIKTSTCSLATTCARTV